MLRNFEQIKRQVQNKDIIAGGKNETGVDNLLVVVLNN